MVKAYFRQSYKKKPKETKELESLKTSTKLIIVESPSKCKKIENFLGDQWTCIASKGHIRTIDGLSSIDPSYNITYSVLPDKKEHIEWMKTILSKFHKDNIYLATDDDREGEAIAWHICDVFELSVDETKRVLFHEITEPAIKAAIERPVHIDMNMVKSQMARQVLDILVGFRISPLLWKHLYRNKENSLSAGRCQTPALRLVYENEIEAKTAVIETKYKITGTFYAKKIDFILSKQLDRSDEVIDFLEKSKTYSHKMIMGTKRESVQQPPKPFSTSSLLQSASSALHMSPKETMSLCQELYQDGHITYMRTESQTYSPVFLSEARDYIHKEYSEVLGENLQSADESHPHEAIRVTHIEARSIDSENRRAVTLYKWIWRRTIESCMPAYHAYHTPVHISAPNDLYYEHIVETPIYLGWKKVEDNSSNKAGQEMIKEQTKGTALMMYIQSSPAVSVPYNQIEACISVHGRHTHYTEASLIHQLEILGIGRPSTFATIINTIIERGYVQKTDIEGVEIKSNEYILSSGKGSIETIPVDKIIGQEKGKLRIQPLGIVVSDFLTEHFTRFFAYDYTKIMEENLDKIAKGEPIELCAMCDSDIASCIKTMTHVTKPTFALRDTTEYCIVFERYGPVLRKVCEDGSYHYENTASNLDIDKLKSGQYSLEEIIKCADKTIGEHDGSPILLKTGPYGRYIVFKDEKTSVDATTSDEEILSTFLEKLSEKKDTNMIRQLTSDISIRNGKYGAYIFYKTEKMKKPKFFNLNSFSESYRLCPIETILKWIKEKHNIP